MVHSFALTPQTLASIQELVVAADPQHETAGYRAAGFTTLAEQGPRVAAARQNFPEMGKDYTAFEAFFWHRPSFKHFTKDVPSEARLLIGFAQGMKVDDDKLFDRIELWSTSNEAELLAVGIIVFGHNILHFPIVQWMTPINGVDIMGWTTTADIRLWYCKKLVERAQKERKRRQICATIAVGALAVPASLIPAIILLQPLLLIPIGIVALAMLIFSVDVQGILGKFLCWIGGGTFVLTASSLFYIMEQITPNV